jgi:hypothetical protein
VWHKGLSLALPVVGPENLWGGPTYIHGVGYVQQPNNGAQVHRSFRHADADGVARGFARREPDGRWLGWMTAAAPASGVRVAAVIEP